jgi:hypothetical protein
MGLGTDVPDPVQRAAALARVFTGFPIDSPLVTTLGAAFLDPVNDPPMDRATVGLPTRPPTEIVMGPGNGEIVTSTIPPAYRR